MKITRWGQVSGVTWCPYSPWPCRIHSSISRTISFVFLPRDMWNTNCTLSPSIILADSQYCSKCPFPSLRWTWFLTCSSPAFTDIEPNLRRREHLLCALLTTHCQLDQLSHRPLCFARLDTGTRSARGCPPHSLWRAFLQANSSGLEYPETHAWLLNWSKVTRSLRIKTWFQNHWRVFIPHLINTFGFCHHLSHRLEHCKRRFCVVDITWFKGLSDLPQM